MCWKVSFDTKSKANQNAKALKKKMGVPIHTYICPECGRWHTSKMSSKAKKDFDRRRQYPCEDLR